MIYLKNKLSIKFNDSYIPLVDKFYIFIMLKNRFAYVRIMQGDPYKG